MVIDPEIGEIASGYVDGNALSQGFGEILDFAVRTSANLQQVQSTFRQDHTSGYGGDIIADHMANTSKIGGIGFGASGASGASGGMTGGSTSMLSDLQSLVSGGMGGQAYNPGDSMGDVVAKAEASNQESIRYMGAFVNIGGSIKTLESVFHCMNAAVKAVKTLFTGQ